METYEFANAVEAECDFYVVMLGTNDAKTLSAKAASASDARRTRDRRRDARTRERECVFCHARGAARPQEITRSLL